MKNIITEGSQIILSNMLKNLFQILLIVTICVLGWACGGNNQTSENKKIELVDKDTGLANKEVEPQQMELDTSEVDADNTNEVEDQERRTTKITVDLSPSWHGDWEDFSVKTSGDFVKDKVRYKWIGGRAQLPKKAGCWAFYDGVTSKSDWVLSFKHAKNSDWVSIESDRESRKNLAQLSDKRFKLVTLVCTENDGEEIPIGADCIHSGYFYDKGSIFKPITCQIGLEFEIELRKIKKK